jgi:uncharacterized protein DUF938
VIRPVFSRPLTVWEIGSGTGQHACYFAGQLPHVNWQPTDRQENIAGIELWRQAAGLANLRPPLILDVTDAAWPCTRIEALFTANTLHIMSWRQVQVFFDRLGQYLAPDAPVCIYGPFNYQGRYTSDSNARFDQWLKSRDPLSGIRDFEAVKALAASIGLQLVDDVVMPANNRLLVLSRQADSG